MLNSTDDLRVFENPAVVDARAALRDFQPRATRAVAQLEELNQQIETATAEANVGALAALLERLPALQRIVDHLQRQDEAARSTLEAFYQSALRRVKQPRDAAWERIRQMEKTCEILRKQIASQEQTAARTNSSARALHALQVSRDEFARLQAVIAEARAELEGPPPQPDDNFDLTPGTALPTVPSRL